MKVEDYSRGREAKVVSWGLGQREGWKVLPGLPRISKSRRNSVSVHVGWCIRFVLSSLSLVLGNCFCSVFLWYHTIHLQRFYTASHCIWTRLSLIGAISVVSFVICVLFAQTMILTIIHTFVHLLSFRTFVYIYIRYGVPHKIPHSFNGYCFLSLFHPCNLNQLTFWIPTNSFFPCRAFMD